MPSKDDKPPNSYKNRPPHGHIVSDGLAPFRHRSNEQRHITPPPISLPSGLTIPTAPSPESSSIPPPPAIAGLFDDMRPSSGKSDWQIWWSQYALAYYMPTISACHATPMWLKLTGLACLTVCLAGLLFAPTIIGLVFSLLCFAIAVNHALGVCITRMAAPAELPAFTDEPAKTPAADPVSDETEAVVDNNAASDNVAPDKLSADGDVPDDIFVPPAYIVPDDMLPSSGALMFRDSASDNSEFHDLIPGVSALDDSELPASSSPESFPDELPVYSILLPIYDEADMVAQLVRHIMELHYPRHLLDIIFVTEANDHATRLQVMNVLQTTGLKARCLTMPAGGNPTKPRACNFALLHAIGTFCVIYDAEDKPHPRQLLESVHSFHKAGRDYACFQAPLVICDTGHHFLDRQMALDYCHVFALQLPAHARLDLPVPLGGTSNHFRTELLRNIYGWDAWNMTEDADLGVRLYECGMKTGMLHYPTYETATHGVGNHMRQRTRWQKGSLVTWLIRLRHPIGLWRHIGAWRFISFQLTMLGRTISPALYLLMLIQGLYMLVIVGETPSLPMMILTMVSYVLLLLAYIMACVRARRYKLLVDIVLVPFFWLFMAFCFGRAMWHFVKCRYVWEKTPHRPFT